MVPFGLESCSLQAIIKPAWATGIGRAALDSYHTLVFVAENS
jgi:hypothetical protein